MFEKKNYKYEEVNHEGTNTQKILKESEVKSQRNPYFEKIYSRKPNKYEPIFRKYSNRSMRANPYHRPYLENF